MLLIFLVVEKFVVAAAHYAFRAQVTERCRRSWSWRSECLYSVPESTML